MVLSCLSVQCLKSQACALCWASPQDFEWCHRNLWDDCLIDLDPGVVVSFTPVEYVEEGWKTSKKNRKLEERAEESNDADKIKEFNSGSETKVKRARPSQQRPCDTLSEPSSLRPILREVVTSLRQ